MPPKKKEVEEKPVILGRMGTNLKCGIVGLPNVGKSTFFNVLTKTQIAAAENFPFCTIDPNENKYQVQILVYEWLCHDERTQPGRHEKSPIKESPTVGSSRSLA